MLRISITALALVVLVAGCGDDLLNPLNKPPEPRSPVFIDPNAPQDPNPDPDPDPDSDPDPDPDPDPVDPDPDPVDPDPEPPTLECYSEPIFPNADVASLVGSYGGGNWKDELIAIMSARHPSTGHLLNEQRNDSYFGQFSDSNNWPNMVGWLDTLSHEETHLHNAMLTFPSGGAHVLYLTEEHTLVLPQVNDFSRSAIYNQMDQVARNGIYADLYFTGWQGERGFLPLLDETSCYLNEVGAVASVGEYFPMWVSVKDGTVAFLYFIELYLKEARLNQPQIWEGLKSHAVLREAVELLWVRAHFLLDFADAFDNLGISDMDYRALMHEPDMMNEISLFIDGTVSDSPCVERAPITH